VSLSRTLAAAGIALMVLLTSEGSQAQGHAPKKTPMTEVALARALHAAHIDVFKKSPSGLRLSVAWAQVALETGRGERVKGYDLGNVGGKIKSFPSARAGAAAYWKAVARCAPAFGYFDVGDAHGAGLQLGRCGYYTASPATYASGMASLRTTFTKTVWPKLAGRLRQK